ncbi:hypothetical protein LNKW23_27820 [Paralimibaculum aggregatum]|uniref:Uncharacterized protein n=1 Tax=Paralimibaculum aggregatum TaxID=3036245 RepID=A0ABQ6LJZ6_9RHOB|nr:hypothetical protein [Limibaculum sp. NKW23]GMG83569.1 hypothetical protein LNKW23_27820 [Limibaculum sp. NKW23]
MPSPRRRATRPPSTWRLALPIAAALLVFTASSTDTLSHLRLGAIRLWQADWGVLLDPPPVPRGEAAAPEALKARILALLNRPEALPGRSMGIARAGYRFDGCVLEFEAVYPEAVCAGDPEHALAGFVDRVNLRDLMLHPAYLEEPGRLVPGEPPTLPRAELVYSWVPRIENALEMGMRDYILMDPPVLREGDTAEKIAFAREVSDRVESGEIGPVLARIHRMHRTCGDVALVEPYLTRVVTFHSRPEERAELSGLFHALERTLCHTRGWIFGW